jgi:hypothetical protein
MESAVVSRHRSSVARASGMVLAGLVALGTMAPATSSAQGLLDVLTGLLRRPAPPPSVSSYAEPTPPLTLPNAPSPDQSLRGPGVAYCVRLCDGRYFPIQRSSGVNAAQACNAFCPAARTRIFSGSMIDHATAADGSRYKDLPSAFVYRARTVADCSCNGKDPYGLVTTDANNDPTLQPGDIVATEKGFVAYTGGRSNTAFTPIGSYGGLSAELRQRLASTRIVPRNATPVPMWNASASVAAGNRRAQLDR